MSFESFKGDSKVDVVTRHDFSAVVASGIDTRKMKLVQSGSGMTIAQAGGNLTIACGTTANAETVIRDKQAYRNDIQVLLAQLRSQAIINNYLSVQLVDVIGDGLTVVASSATVAVVTVPATSAHAAKFAEILSVSSTGMVGMKMFIGACASLSGAIPGQYAVSAAVANSDDSVTLTFTVSGWTAGSGTCSVYGWNYVHAYSNSATATQMYFDCACNGWPSTLGDVATTVNATTSGHELQLRAFDEQIEFLDTTIASANAFTSRATRGATREGPDGDVDLYFQIVARNGSTAPASTTTWTIYGATVTATYSQPVVLNSLRTNAGQAQRLPVSVDNTPAVTVSSGTLTTVSTVTSVTAVAAATPATPTTASLTSAATTNATLVKSSSGRLFEILVENKAATGAYVHFFNAASAPTVGTTVDLFSVPVAANSIVSIPLGTMGLYFSTGIAFSITSGSALYTDTTVMAAAATVKLALSYI